MVSVWPWRTDGFCDSVKEGLAVCMWTGLYSEVPLLSLIQRINPVYL